MSLQRRSFICMGLGVVGAMLACSSIAHAELLGYWSANSPNEDFILKNDQGNEDLDGELFGEVTYTADGTGFTGQAGDYAIEFNGTDEDYAELPHSEGVVFEQITLAAWMKGEPTGDWSGIFQSRGGPPIGIGYGGDSGNLTYTWNDNSADSWNFGATQPQLSIPQNEWTFVALSLTPDDATLFVGPKGGTLEQATNEIPHIAQLPAVPWRLGEDNCCGTERNFLGQMDEVAIWNHALLPRELAQLHDMSKIPTDFAEPSGGLRRVPVGGTEIGTEALSGSLSDIVRGEPAETSGLSQFWYEGNMRGDVEAFQDAGDTGSEANPLVTEPFASPTTWWAGSQGTDVISDYPIPRYPAELAGTRFEGSSNEGNYGVRLTGEIFIAENGEYLIRDGIADFAMVAIDQDGNGELDEFDFLSSADVGAAGFGDVLVLDDDFANIDGSSQQERFHGLANIEDIPADGAWRRIEVWMSAAENRDGAILYMANLEDPDIFDTDDEFDTNAPSQEQRDKFVIRNDQLRTTASVVESANAAAGLRTDVEYVVQVGADGNDQFSIDNNDGVYTTTLDVSNVNLLIEAGEGLAEGTDFKIFDVDNLVGLDTLTITAEGFDLTKLAEGIITFGAPVPMFLEADFNEDGIVDFTDFLTLSTQFNQTVDPPGTPPDIDGSGTVDFADFLVLSTQFNMTSGGAAAVPEPTSLALFGFGAMLIGLVRRRRSLIPFFPEIEAAVC